MCGPSLHAHNNGYKNISLIKFCWYFSENSCFYKKKKLKSTLNEKSPCNRYGCPFNVSIKVNYFCHRKRRIPKTQRVATLMFLPYPFNTLSGHKMIHFNLKVGAIALRFSTKKTGGINAGEKSTYGRFYQHLFILLKRNLFNRCSNLVTRWRLPLNLWNF